MGENMRIDVKESKKPCDIGGRQCTLATFFKYLQKLQFNLYF